MPQPTRPTQRDVADRAGVSTATVSYILSGRRGYSNPVTEQTRERVLAAAAELGYQRNHVARSLRRRRTELVCVVHKPPFSPWLEQLTDQLHEAAVSHGYSVITLPLAKSDWTENALRVLKEHYVDGAIVAPDYDLPAAELESLAKSGLALLVFDDEIAPAGFDVIRQGEHTACYAAVEHLAERGHRRIAFLGHGDDAAEARADRRFGGYQQALVDHGLPVDDTLIIPAAGSRTRAYREVTELLSRADRPTAVFSASDRAAVHTIWAARDAGLSVPQDIAVAGVGNTGEGAAVRPALTSVGIPSLDFGIAIDRLFDRITATPVRRGKELHLPWELIVREST